MSVPSVIIPAPSYMDEDVKSEIHNYPAKIFSWFVKVSYAKYKLHRPIVTDECSSLLVNKLHAVYGASSVPLKKAISVRVEKDTHIYSVDYEKVPVIILSTAVFNVSKVYKLSGDMVKALRTKAGLQVSQNSTVVSPPSFSVYIELQQIMGVDQIVVRDAVDKVKAGFVFTYATDSITGTFQSRKDAVFYMSKMLEALAETTIKVKRYRLFDTLLDSSKSDIFDSLS